MEEITTWNMFFIAMLGVIFASLLGIAKILSDSGQKYLKTWLDIQQESLEEKKKAILKAEINKAITDGVHLATQTDIVNKRDPSTPEFTDEDKKGIAMDFVKKSVGDALNIGVDMLSDRIEAKIGEMKTTAVNASPAPILQIEPPAEITIKEGLPQLTIEDIEKARGES